MKTDRRTNNVVGLPKVYQLLAHDRWFSPNTSASSNTKTGRRDIAKILLNRIDAVTVSLLALSVVDRGFKPRSGQILL
jgi:hypothetical protein